MKVAAFECVHGLYAGGVEIVSPNYAKYGKSIPKDPGGFRFWCYSGIVGAPLSLGKRFPFHDRADSPYILEYYYRRREPWRLSKETRDQLDEATALIADRPMIILDHTELPQRTPPYSTRRNAWAISGGRIIDRKDVITLQEAHMTIRWLKKKMVLEGIGGGREMAAIALDCLDMLPDGSLEPHVAEWRSSGDCWPESKFAQPDDARFDVRWFKGNHHEGSVIK